MYVGLYLAMSFYLARVRAVLRAAIAEKLAKVEPSGDPLALTGKPHVVLVLGVLVVRVFMLVIGMFMVVMLVIR